METLIQIIKHKVLHGCIQIAVSAFLTYRFGLLFYEHHFTSTLFLIMFPDWILVTGMLFGLIGVWAGITTIKGTQKIWYGYLVIIVIHIFEFFVYMF